MAEPVKIFINGFGRIGRAILRIYLQNPDGFELCGVNDIEPLETCAYLFEYDSVYGHWPTGVSIQSDGLIVGDEKIIFTHTNDISTLDLSGIDVVLECTGLTSERVFEERGLVAGAKNVLISGPCDDADITLVLGANEAQLSDQHVVSNASCTTNALAPLAKLLDDKFGIVSGQMTTVHCYTSSQPTVDQPRKNLARSRAAGLSMVPTTTSAHRLLGQVLPDLSGKIEARAIRVPTASVSAIDLTLQMKQPVTADELNRYLKSVCDSSDIIGWTEQPLVSSDLRARTESIVICGPETSVSVGGLVRVFGWYDNEWGFSCRMLDMASLLAARG